MGKSGRHGMGIRVLNPSFYRNSDDSDDDEKDKPKKIRISVQVGGGGGGGGNGRDPKGDPVIKGDEDEDEDEDENKKSKKGKKGEKGEKGKKGGEIEDEDKDKDEDEDEDEDDSEDGGKDDGKDDGKGEPIIIYVPGGGGPPQPWEDEPDNRGPSRTEEKNLRQEVAKKIIRHRVTEADRYASSDLLTWAEKTLKAKSDWRTLLRSAVARAVAYVQGNWEASRLRPSRRSELYPDLVIPGMAEPVLEVAVVLDVSGSMAQQYEKAPPGSTIMDQAISELDSILRSFGQTGVCVYASDTAVAWAGKVFDLNKVSITDLTGGTDLTVGIDAAYKAGGECYQPHIIVVLTDGWTDWPQKNKYRDAKIIAGIIGVTREQYGGSGTKLPKFIEAVYINN
jgi:hypothetical protein